VNLDIYSGAEVAYLCHSSADDGIRHGCLLALSQLLMYLFRLASELWHWWLGGGRTSDPYI